MPRSATPATPYLLGIEALDDPGGDGVGGGGELRRVPQRLPAVATAKPAIHSGIAS